MGRAFRSRRLWFRTRTAQIALTFFILDVFGSVCVDPNASSDFFFVELPARGGWLIVRVLVRMNVCMHVSAYHFESPQKSDKLRAFIH